MITVPILQMRLLDINIRVEAKCYEKSRPKVWGVVGVSVASEGRSSLGRRAKEGGWTKWASLSHAP